jgi:putative endonuclease
MVSGDLAEEAVGRAMEAAGWVVLARNVRIGRSELDIVARDRADVLVIVEVRSRSGPRLGAPEESVDRAKVARIYAAARGLLRAGRLPDGRALDDSVFRADLVTVVRDGPQGTWRLVRHLRGLAPP